MSNLSDKDIDRLSRDAAEFYEPDDSMLSWNKLEQQLVKHIPERPPDAPSVFRIRTLIWAPSVLLLAGLTYYIIKNTAYRRDSTLKTRTENTVSQPADQSHLNGTDKVLDNNPAGSASPAETNPANAKALKDHSENKAYRDRTSAEAMIGKTATASAENAVSPDNLAAKKSHGKDRNAVQEKNQNKIRNGRSISQPELSNKNAINEAAQRNIQNAFSPVPANDIEKQMGKTGSSGAVHLPSVIVSNAHPSVHGNDASLNRFSASDNAQKQPASKSLQINRSLVIGLTTGPDYTSVGSMPNNQLSNNFGISLGYYLSKRLSVNTGFQYTTKYYWSDGKPFQPRSQPLNSAIVMYAPFPHIESVNGRCNMFEIPLTLRYDIYQHEKVKLFVNAGFSSYLMRKQNYTYFFHNSGRAYEWDNENNDHRNYWFAIGNISAGIEQDLGKGFSFQAEPFVRLPFRGIGVGDMKMTSYGMLFSIRYSPVLGRTRK